MYMCSCTAYSAANTQGLIVNWDELLYGVMITTNHNTHCLYLALSLHDCTRGVLLMPRLQSHPTRF